MSRNENSAGSGLVERLLAIMARLRDPEHGCPWDLEQTFYSIAPYTVEEAHEVADAIERGNFDDLREELGDRSEERRVGKECRSGGWTDEKKKERIDGGNEKEEEREDTLKKSKERIVKVRWREV